MKSVTGFEDLRVWQEGMELAERVYCAMSASRDYALKDQMQRAAVSIPSNIAEGYERGSNLDFVRFLSYARASAGELRTQLILAMRVRQVREDTAVALTEQTRKISAMLQKYIETRKRNFS